MQNKQIEFSLVFRDAVHFKTIFEKLNKDYGARNWSVRGNSLRKQFRKGTSNVKRTVVINNDSEDPVALATMLSLM